MVAPGLSVIQTHKGSIGDHGLYMHLSICMGPIGIILLHFSSEHILSQCRDGLLYHHSFSSTTSGIIIHRQ